MIIDNVTKIKNINKNNIKYMLTWIIYYTWCVVFTTWWTSSPMTDASFGVDSRTILHSLYLISSAIVIFIMRQDKFKKYASFGAISVIINAVLFALTQNNILPFLHLPATIILAISIGFVNIGVLIPLVFILNNTEKFYSIVLSNFLISILVLLQEANILNITNGFIFSFILLIIALLPICFFKVSDYEEEKTKFEKHIPKYTKAIYITLVLNLLYAAFCKGIGKAFINVANDMMTNSFNLNITFYIGGILGCVLYYFIYKKYEKCNNITWNLTFVTFAFAMFIYAISQVDLARYVFSIFVGIGSTIGMINMYYILGVIGKKYWNYTYVRLSILFIGVLGGVAGIIMGNFITINNNVESSIIILIISMIVVFTLIFLNSKFQKVYYSGEWNDDSTYAAIDNLSIRKYQKYKLSNREMEVCNKIIAGMTTRQIAIDMNLSEYTIKEYRKNIFKKLNISSKDELIKKI